MHFLYNLKIRGEKTKNINSLDGSKMELNLKSPIKKQYPIYRLLDPM